MISADEFVSRSRWDGGDALLAWMLA